MRKLPLLSLCLAVWWLSKAFTAPIAVHDEIYYLAVNSKNLRGPLEIVDCNGLGMPIDDNTNPPALNLVGARIIEYRELAGGVVVMKLARRVPVTWGPKIWRKYMGQIGIMQLQNLPPEDDIVW